METDMPNPGGDGEAAAGGADTCPRCGTGVEPGDGFCEECGAPLLGQPEPVRDPAAAPRAVATPYPWQPPAAATPRPCVECGFDEIGADGYCQRCGTRQPAARDHVELDVPGLGAASDKGLRHTRNEDAMAVLRADAGVIAVVSDGVSSSPCPDDASRAAADAGAGVLGERLAAGDDPETATKRAVERAAADVAALAESESHAPACTYVSALVGDGTVTVGWVGDSRAYWLPADPEAVPPVREGGPPEGAPAELGAAALLTEDDSWAGRMVAWGVMTEQEAQADAKAHVLTGWLGADAGALDPKVRTYAPTGPGAVVVCSDGLWNYLPEAETLRAAAPDAVTDPRGTAAALVRRALDMGGHDNVTVVVVPFPPPAQPTGERQR